MTTDIKVVDTINSVILVHLKKKSEKNSAGHGKC